LAILFIFRILGDISISRRLGFVLIQNAVAAISTVAPVKKNGGGRLKMTDAAKIAAPTMAVMVYFLVFFFFDAGSVVLMGADSEFVNATKAPLEN
jgi:hypothetical protein